MTALVLGYEIACRIGIASKLRMTMHPHGSWGTIGGAVAVGKLMDLNVDRNENPDQYCFLYDTCHVEKDDAGGRYGEKSLCWCKWLYGNFSLLPSNERFYGRSRWDRISLWGRGFDSFSPEIMVDELGSRYEITRNYFKAVCLLPLQSFSSRCPL